MRDVEILNKWYVKYRLLLVIVGALLFGIIGIPLLIAGIWGYKKYHLTNEYAKKKRLKQSKKQTKSTSKQKKTVVLTIVILLIAGGGIGLLLFFSFGTSEPYTDNVMYECIDGNYFFPEDEPIFETVSPYFIDWGGFQDDECVLDLNYKIKMKGYFGDGVGYSNFDACKLTMSQLANLKKEKADITTAVKRATCDLNTNHYLKNTVGELK